MQIAFSTLGCKVNQFDTQMMEKLAGDKSYELVPFENRADVYVINTCTVTQKSNYQSRQLVRRAFRQNPYAKIVVTGCYAETHPEEIKALPGVSLVLGNAYKTNLLDYLEDCGQSQPQPQLLLINGFKKGKGLQQPILDGFRERSRIFLKIQDGCNFRCSFCIIPKARGPSRSLPMQQVMDQINRVVENGYHEVVLTGVYIGAYGNDLNPKITLSSLLQEISWKTDLKRLRISSMDPKDFNRDLIETLCHLPNLCHHLHIPLQSGNDQILIKMRRGYTAGFFKGLILELKQRLTDIHLSTDIMVGFPGETEGQFQETFDLLKALPIASFHVFPFSTRPGTPASEMRGQVSCHKKKERVALLRDLSSEKEDTFKRSFVGKKMEIIILKKGKESIGISRNYINVAILDTTNHLPVPLSLTKTRIAFLKDGQLYGRIESAV